MTTNPFGGSGASERRDSWCTPRWLTDLIGQVDYDPCSNERSTVRAHTKNDGLYGYDGLKQLAADSCKTFINPPYSRGQVARWVEAYKNTDFIFLLRWDPSTAWFAELMKVTEYVWFAERKRIAFEPPPGVKSSSNPYPHALYCRSRPNEALYSAGLVLRR